MGTKYTINDITYDTDGQKIKLPKTMEIIVPDEEHTCYDEIENFISNEISNRTGFCHKGFTTTPAIKE